LLTNADIRFPIELHFLRYNCRIMAWRFRKSLKLGPVRVSLSKAGVTYFVGGLGFRVGWDARGRFYATFFLPATGHHSRTYSNKSKTVDGIAAPLSNAAPGGNRGLTVALGILTLASMAGGLLVFSLIPHPALAPTVTPSTVAPAP
jgi:hypothetical protein